MNPVDWLQNLLHGIDPMWILFVLSWAVGSGWIMSLMKVAARADRRAEQAERRLANELWWQEEKAKSAGPRATAKTLMDELQERV